MRKCHTAFHMVVLFGSFCCQISFKKKIRYRYLFWQRDCHLPIKPKSCAGSPCDPRALLFIHPGSGLGWLERPASASWGRGQVPAHSLCYHVSTEPKVWTAHTLSEAQDSFLESQVPPLPPWIPATFS